MPPTWRGSPEPTLPVHTMEPGTEDETPAEYLDRVADTAGRLFAAKWPGGKDWWPV